MMGGGVGAEVDVAIVGAGAVGLACAAELARAGHSAVILERNDGIARETSSRNSEVVHAGIYYPVGSDKAQLCVEGRELLYERCARLRIGHRKVGKLIVATRAEEVPELEALGERGRANGVPGLRMLRGDEVADREPWVRANAALWSPSTGIVDAHALCLSWLAEAESHGATLALHTTLLAVESLRDGYRLAVREADGTSGALVAAQVVNAAGLASDAVAALGGIDVEAKGLRLHLCKGDYFSVAPSAPLRFSHLVYPAPDPAGLGIHVTMDLGGRLRLGPDAHYVAAPDLRVDPDKARRFAEAAGRYLREVRAEWLAPDYAGLRPRLAAPGEGFRDFAIREESEEGLPGWVNLVGIESPGLTAASAIARRVLRLLRS